MPNEITIELEEFLSTFDFEDTTSEKMLLAYMLGVLEETFRETFQAD